MKMLDEYIINGSTSMLVPEYNSTGHLCTRAFEENHCFFVAKSPIDIIKESLLYYGNDWKGATTASRSILGNVDMVPIKICGTLGLYWFPHKSPHQHDCVWFALAHVLNYETKKTNNYLQVVVTGDHEIMIDSSYSRYDRQVSRTRKLRDILHFRHQPKRTLIKKRGYIIIRDQKRKHYRILQPTPVTEV